MKDLIRELKKNRKNNLHIDFAKCLHQGLVSFDDNFVERCLVDDVFPDPVNGNFIEDFKFIMLTMNEFIKLNTSPNHEERVRNFLIQEWVKWLEMYLLVGRVCEQIKSELKKTMLINVCQEDVIKYSFNEISYKLNQESNKQILHSSKERFVANINTINGAISIYEMEHGLIDALDIFTRFFQHSEGSNSEKSIEFAEWNRVFMLCQIWYSWQNCWNKIKLNQFKLVNVENKKILIPKSEIDFKRQHSSKIRLNNKLEEIDYLLIKNFPYDSILEYDLAIKEVSKEVSLIYESMGGIVDAVSKQQLEGLLSKKQKISLFNSIKVNILFHEINLKNLKFEYNTNADDLLKVIDVLMTYSDIFGHVFKEPLSLNNKNIDALINFTEEKWEKVFGNIVSNPLDYLRLLSFPKKRLGSTDLWCTPFVKNKELYIALPHSIKNVSPLYMIESFSNTYNTDESSKILGDAFEEQIRNIFKQVEAPVYFKKTNGLQFDCLSFYDGLWFLVEVKRTSTISSPHDLSRANSRIQDGVDQVKLRYSYLLSNDGQKFISSNEIFKNFPLPNESNLLRLCCTNIFDFSGQIRDEIIITDENILKRFIQNQAEKAESINFKNESRKVIYKILTRSPGEIKLNDAIKYFKEPVQVDLVLKSSEICYRQMISNIVEKEFIFIADYKYINEKYIELSKQRIIQYGNEIDDDLEF